MPLRDELIKIQKSLWRRNNEIINSSIIVKESDFVAYERKYKKAVSSFERVATHDEMLEAIKAARIVYVGDYHTCNQSQRSFLRILKAILPEEKDIVLGLELVHQRHQKVLDAFMGDKISEERFVKKIGLRQHWVFDLWPNFKPLFDIAKFHDLPVAGIDAASLKANLQERDEATAKLITHLLKKYPRHRIFVMIGDLHLAHLPKIVQMYAPSEVEGSKCSSIQVHAPSGVEGFKCSSACPERSREVQHARKVQDVILYQNSDTIYWKLAETGLEHRVEVVKIDERSFCRMHTPPVVCQQSYINWLEHEEGEIDFSDSKTSFMELVSHIAKFLEIDIGDKAEKVDVYTCGDLSFLAQLKEGGKFSARELKALEKQILASESYFIPEKHIVYLANLSINHAAEEAAHFLKHACSGREFKRTAEDAFYANILHEALAFFGSKLINAKRKCFHEREFRGLLAYFETIRVPQDRRLEFETACMVLDFLKAGQRGLSHGRLAKILRPDLFFSVTHGLGYMLGDRLFYAMMSERINKEDVRELFRSPWRREGEPMVVYCDLLKRLKGIKMPKRL